MRNILLPLLLIATGTSAFAAEKISVYAFELPPFALQNNGKAEGDGIRLVEEMLKKADMEGDFKIYPLPRITQQLSETSGIAVLLTRTPARENNYQWIAPLFMDKFVFITAPDKKAVGSLEAARPLGKIASLAEGAPTAYLTSQGLTNLDPTPSETSNYKKLLSGRVDAWYTNVTHAKYVIKAENQKLESVVFGDTITEAPFWIAASPKTPAETIKKLQTAYEELKKSGYYDDFVKKVQ